MGDPAPANGVPGSAATETGVRADHDPRGNVPEIGGEERLPDQRVGPGLDTNCRWLVGLTLAGVGVGVALRIHALRTLPGELYGDIAIVYEYVAAVRDGRWPTGFVLSAGPLYPYLAAVLTWIVGLDFIGLKMVSVLVSGSVLWATYGFARQIAHRTMAAVALCITGVSSWLLVFSRLGNSQILAPALAMGSLYFVVRAAREHRWWQAAMSGLLAGLGVYLYPQTFALAPVVGLTLLVLRWTRAGVRWRDVQIFVLAAVATTLPFLAIVDRQRDNFFDGYIGGKLDTADPWWSVLFDNLWRSALAFHVRGDVVFRSNPAHSPHLDVLSGVLFVAGIASWLRPGWRRWSPAILVPFVLLQLPAALVLGRPTEIPSASRTLAVAPLAYVLTASGLVWIASVVAGRRWVGRSMIVVALVTITALNAHRYFASYSNGLPNANLAIGRTIAGHLAQLPAETHAFIVSCCWADGEPEPKGIQYLDAGPVATGLIELPKSSLDCATLAQLPRPAVLIWAATDPLPAPALASCAAQFAPEIHSRNGVQVFASAAMP